jgi:hypothetical protein
VQQALAKNEIAKIFVGGQEHRLSVDRLRADDTMSCLSRRTTLGSTIRPCLIEVDNFLVDVLVRHDRHARTDSIG